ncbi:hypothetical protein DPMN_094665 [Dreissena polymorpha]|uniref:Uncharacterized protein n=1 Tax=Dreissena polymorpha TaxID=45954 RepID=A0A9D4R209_DREPO|nr:hypothetical protein DPMN_094665 [Dreissena polymorpha]
MDRRRTSLGLQWASVRDVCSLPSCPCKLSMTTTHISPSVKDPSPSRDSLMTLTSSVAPAGNFTISPTYAMNDQW